MKRKFKILISLSLLTMMIAIFNVSSVSAACTLTDFSSCGRDATDWVTKRGGGTTDTIRDTMNGYVDFYMKNQTSSTIWVVLIEYLPYSEVWHKVGWYKLESGERALLLSNYNNRYLYYYAHDSQGRKWEGTDFRTSIVGRKFRNSHNYSYSSQEGGYIVGFRKVDTGNNSTYTLNLTN